MQPATNSFHNHHGTVQEQIGTQTIQGDYVRHDVYNNSLFLHVEPTLPTSQQPWTSGNRHWGVSRASNVLFTGRRAVRKQITDILQTRLDQGRGEDGLTHVPLEPCHIVVTGVGGQGKSELCLQVANDLRQRFWAVFWVDVGGSESAKAGFLDIAKMIHAPAETVEYAVHAISNIAYPWLLILDNADDPHKDYQMYFPTGTYGSVLMTSRNDECSQYGTSPLISLDGLDEKDANDLLLEAARVPLDQRSSQEAAARSVCDLLGQHPLALLQAGAYVAQKHCGLAEYPRVYQHQRERLLRFHPHQARSRYGDMYTTFEASRAVLESSSSLESQDALELLAMFSMMSANLIPLSSFEKAWEMACGILLSEGEENVSGFIYSNWHVNHLISLLRPSMDRLVWDPFRLTSALALLKSLALVSQDSDSDVWRAHMHPVVHAWAGDRLDREDHARAWMAATCVLTFSLQGVADLLSSGVMDSQGAPGPHVQALLERTSPAMLMNFPREELLPVVHYYAVFLGPSHMDQLAHRFLRDALDALGWHLYTPVVGNLYLYQTWGNLLLAVGDIKGAKKVFQNLVKIGIRGSDAEYVDRLEPYYGLILAYEAEGRSTKAVSIFEHLLKKKRESLSDKDKARSDLEERLAGAYVKSGHAPTGVAILERILNTRARAEWKHDIWTTTLLCNLGKAYCRNDCQEEGILALKKLVQAAEQKLPAEHETLLMAQFELATAYIDYREQGRAIPLLKTILQAKEPQPSSVSSKLMVVPEMLACAYRDRNQTLQAIALFEKILSTKVVLLPPTDLSLLSLQHELAIAYRKDGQLEKAITLMEQITHQHEQVLPPDDTDRLYTKHNLATTLWMNGQPWRSLDILRDIVPIMVSIFPNRWDDGHRWPEMALDFMERFCKVSLDEQPAWWKCDGGQDVVTSAPADQALTDGCCGDSDQDSID